jgi:hypothetical protein
MADDGCWQRGSAQEKICCLAFKLNSLIKNKRIFLRFKF